MAPTPNTKDMANAIRALSMDAVQQANSGHPGAPMGMADMAVALWGEHLRHNPANPHWANRDRFVLSNGHGSMLIYALLHLTGYKLPIDELKNFRQLHSKTAGHPEFGITPGVETTTGPLGQGITNAVGMALAEKLLAKEFNREGHAIVDHHTYVFLGDGCLMEGISHEAAALAGAWKLSKLIALYDDNGISIDGQVAPWFIDNTAQRFVAYGWNVIGPIDGHDAAAGVCSHCRSQEPAPTTPHADHLQDRTSARAAPTAPTPPRPTASLWAPKKSSSPAKPSAGATRPSSSPKRSMPTGTPRPKARPRKPRGTTSSPPTKPPSPSWPKSCVRRMKGDLPKNFVQTAVDTVIAAHQKGETVASRKASAVGAGVFHRSIARNAGRLCRLDRLQPDQHQEHAQPAF